MLEKSQLYVGIAPSVRPTFHTTGANKNQPQGHEGCLLLPEEHFLHSVMIGFLRLVPTVIYIQPSGKTFNASQPPPRRHCRATGVLVVRQTNTGADGWEFMAAAESNETQPNSTNESLRSRLQRTETSNCG